MHPYGLQEFFQSKYFDRIRQLITECIHRKDSLYESESLISLVHDPERV